MGVAAWRRVARTSAGAVIVALAVGCGSDSTGPDVLDNGSMSAKVDGASWSATTAIAATYNSNILGIAGTDAAGRSVGFGAAVSAPGTFTIAVTSPANGLVNEAGKAWQAAGSVGSGTITITAISATGAKGTFQFTAAPVAGTGATGNKVVTEGVFDVTF